MRWYWLLALLLSATPAAGQTTATFVGTDTVTRGAWKSVYGALGVSLYPDGGSMTEASFARGVGTIQVQGMNFGGALTFDARAPQRYTVNNCCDPVAYTDAGGIARTVATGAPWPPDARFAAGLYHRAADGVPMRLGVTLTAPRLVCFYLVDFDRRGRAERIDVYAEGPLDGDTTGSLGLSHANGLMLDSQTFSHFEEGTYVCWNVTGPAIFQFTAQPTDGNTLAVEGGLFLDAVDPCPFKAPPTITWPTPIPQGAPFMVQADHDGLSCTGVPAHVLTAYCLFDDMTSLPAAITPHPGPTTTAYGLACPAPALLAGPHTVQVGVTNLDGENRSDILAFTISAPVPPALGPCTYVAPGATALQQRPIGAVIHGINQIATQGARWVSFLRWGWRIDGDPLTTTTVDISITCKGLPLPVGGA